MISILQSISELDKSQQLQKVMLECYRTALESAAQYAVELDADMTPQHRKNLIRLAEVVSSSDQETSLVDTRAALRSELRHYRDQASAYLSRLRQDLAAKATSLQQIFEQMAIGDGDHEVRLTTTLKQLRELSAHKTPPASELLAVAASLDQNLQELKRHNQMTVAQFLVEIQMLHQRIEVLQTAASVDQLTQLASRAELESLIAKALSKPGAVSLLLVGARNFAAVERQFGGEIHADLLAAFAKRLHNSLPAESSSGRWDRDHFVIILPVAKVDAMRTAKIISEHVSGIYVCTHAGKTHRPVLQVDVGVVDSPSGGNCEKLIARVEQYFRATTT